MPAAGRQSLPTPVFIRNMSIHGGDCVDVLLSCIQPTKKQVISCRRRRKNTEKMYFSRTAGGGKSEKMHFYWYLFLKNHYSNALPERGAASSNPGIHQISPQKWWTQVWVHHFWDLDVYTQRKSKNMKNDGPNSGYIIFGVFFSVYHKYTEGIVWGGMVVTVGKSFWTFVFM